MSENQQPEQEESMHRHNLQNDVVATNDDDDDDPARQLEMLENMDVTGPNDYSLYGVFFVFIVPSLGGFLFGYDIAATSYVLKALVDDNSSDGWSNIIVSLASLRGTTVSLPAFGALLSSLILFLLNDCIGRRTELQIGALLYAIGGTLEFLAGIDLLFESPDLKVLGLVIFLSGRLVYGLGIGVSMHAAPTYMGEMGPSSVRGFMVSMKEACIVLGILVGYTFGYLFRKWHFTYGSSVIPAIIMLFLATYAIPESCRWLLLKGPERETDALASLKFVFPAGQTAEEKLRLIRISIQQERRLRNLNTDDENENDNENAPLLAGSSLKTLMEKKYRRPLIVGFGLVILQQVTGQPSVLSYATQIFDRAGLPGSSAISVAVFKLMATLSAAIVVERFGRVKLLLLGCALMLIALLVLASSFGGIFLHHETIKMNCTLLAMFFYIGGYQVGFGPITWLMTSEVFPLAIRGQSVAVAVQLNFLLNALVQFGVPVVEKWLGLGWTFGIFAILDVVSLVFIGSYIPETKGLTLEEIEHLFTSQESRHCRHENLNNVEPGASS